MALGLEDVQRYVYDLGEEQHSLKYLFTLFLPPSPSLHAHIPITVEVGNNGGEHFFCSFFKFQKALGCILKFSWGGLNLSLKSPGKI